MTPTVERLVACMACPTTGNRESMAASILDSAFIFVVQCQWAPIPGGRAKAASSSLRWGNFS